MPHRKLSDAERRALAFVQSNIAPAASEAVDTLATELAGLDGETIDERLAQSGRELVAMMRTRPEQLSETVLFGMSFAFVELVRERLAAMPPVGRG
jgi:hypothetical protein